MASSALGKRALIPTIIWIIFGTLVAIESYKLNIGQFRNPGAGMMPFLLGIILIIVSLIALVQCLMNINRGRKKEESIWAGVNFWELGMIVLVQLAYGFMIERVGFSLTTFCCMFFLFKVAGSAKVTRALFLAIITVISAYLLFVIALKVELPSFPLKIF